MTQYIHGFHDPGGEALMEGAPGWVVKTEAIGSDPYQYTGGDYRHLAPHTPIVRLNNGYYPAGTIPLPEAYFDFATCCANHVAASQGCRHWIIGNEPNHEQERPNGQMITPHEYAQCFTLCHEAIKNVQPEAIVITAAIAPWNVSTKYPGNDTGPRAGDWIRYFLDMLDALLGIPEGIALHTYTHGPDPALITSEAKMNAPFEDRNFNFRAYRDFIAYSPKWAQRLPVYITETDQDDPWLDANNGWIQAAYQEIDRFNHLSYPTKIHCLACYRWSTDDQWAMCNKDAVLDDFQDAVALRYESPVAGNPTPPDPIDPPTIGAEPERDIDPALLSRGVVFEFANVPVGTGYWRLVTATWLDEHEADAVGPDHHILGTISRDYRQISGIPFLVAWPSGNTTILSKADDPNASYNYDYAMSASLNEFSIWPDDGSPTDRVYGIGMGKDGNPREHTSTWLEWVWSVGEEPPEPTPPEIGRALLIWPVNGPVTQRFGEPPPRYGQFGHNGVDISCPIGTPVVAAGDGVIQACGWDADGYGNWVHLYVPAADMGVHVAHLDSYHVVEGQHVSQGETIGLSGNTGNSTGPHCHVECRCGERDRYTYSQYGYSQGRVDPQTVMYQFGAAQP